MSSNEIIDRLNRHIAKGFREEENVTYLLLQLGKLIERQGTKRQYPALSFYRNWVVHEKLGSVGANPEMKVILDRFEALVQASQSGGNTAALTQQITDSISLRKLGAEINVVFDSDPQIDGALVDRAENWPDFGGLLLRVLSDIPLQADRSYRFIQELKVSGANGQFDTLEITPRSGAMIPVPLAR